MKKRYVSLWPRTVSEILLAGFSALGLGGATAVHPCMAVLNVSAASLIVGRSAGGRTPISTGLFYLAGRIMGYVIIGTLLKYGLFAVPELARSLQNSVYKFLGPVLILSGMIISGLLPFGSVRISTTRLGLRPVRASKYSTVLTGLFHTFAFCPASAGFYFGILVPMSLRHGAQLPFSAIYGAGVVTPLAGFLILTKAGLHVFKRDGIQRLVRVLPTAGGTALILLGVYFSLTRIFIR